MRIKVIAYTTEKWIATRDDILHLMCYKEFKIPELDSVEWCSWEFIANHY